MNIFYLHQDPIVCAQYHCDIHVVKMILETAQLLSTAHHVSGSGTEEMYKPTHVNHPSAKWARNSVENYNWLYRLFVALCDEYTFRYNKIHKSSRLISNLETPPALPNLDFNQPTQAMPEEYKRSCSIKAYHRYYISKQYSMSRPMRYTNRQIPAFLQLELAA